MLKEIEKRQSIRKYKDTAVEKEKITEIACGKRSRG